MNRVLGAITVFVLVVFHVVNGVKVSVYYEALCPNSRNFIVHQLFPYYSEIANYVELDLVPYGKAMHNEKNGIWKFICQHGPSECEGNKYQSCALSLKSGAETDIKFVSCVMGGSDPSSLHVVEYCAKKFNLDIDKIKACASSNVGDRLLASNGDKTWNLQPTISEIPTIVYDDVFDQISSKQSWTNFLGVLCSKLKEPKPTICNNGTPGYWGCRFCCWDYCLCW